MSGPLAIAIIPVRMTRHVIQQLNMDDTLSPGPTSSGDVELELELPDSSKPEANLAVCTASPIVYVLDREDASFVADFLRDWKRAKKEGKPAVVQMSSKKTDKVCEVEVRANPYARVFKEMCRGRGKRQVNATGGSSK